MHEADQRCTFKDRASAMGLRYRTRLEESENGARVMEKKQSVENIAQNELEQGTERERREKQSGV